MPNPPDPVPLVVLTTLGDRSQAVAFVRNLVADRLVACGTVLDDAVSIYRWKDDITEEREVLVILKTTSARWDSLQDTIAERHPYDIPELLALPIRAGLEPYLRWLTAETD